MTKPPSAVATTVEKHRSSCVEKEALTPAQLIDYFGFELGCDLRDAALALNGSGMSAALWGMEDVPTLRTPPLGFHLFSLCLSGHGLLTQSHLPTPVDVGSEVSFFTPSGAELEIGQRGSVTMLHIMLDEPLIQHATQNVTIGRLPDGRLAPTVGWSGILDPGMHATSLMILVELLSGRLDCGEASTWLAQGLSLQIARRLQLCAAEGQAGDMPLSNDMIDRIFVYMHDNLGKQITARDVAQAHGMTLARLDAAFHMRLGIGSATYLERARAFRAWMLQNVLDVDPQIAARRSGYASTHEMHERADRVVNQADAIDAAQVMH